MKNELLKVKERLNERIDYLATKSVLEKAIYILTDRVIPSISDYPAIGIKDGAVDYTLAGGTISGGADLHAVQRIRITPFVRLLREEDPVTGNDIEKGLLDLVEDIKTAVNGFNPDEENGSPFIIESESESQVLADEVFVQMKDLVFIRFAQVTI